MLNEQIFTVLAKIIDKSDVISNIESNHKLYTSIIYRKIRKQIQIKEVLEYIGQTHMNRVRERKWENYRVSEIEKERNDKRFVCKRETLTKSKRVSERELESVKEKEKKELVVMVSMIEKEGEKK